MKQLTLKRVAINLSIIFIPVLLVYCATTYRNSNIPECTQADLYSTTKWGACTEEGTQTRGLIENKDYSCRNPGKVNVPELKRFCN